MKKIAPLWLGLSFGLQLFACNPSTTSGTDHSVLQILANPQAVPGDGVAKSTLTITATAADGVSPYSGSANLNSTVPLKFGTSQSNSETLTITNGAATETVSCDGKATSLCYGPAVIYGYLESNGAGMSGQVTVNFDAPDAGPVDAGVDAGMDAGTQQDAGPKDAGPDGGNYIPNSIISLGVMPPYLGVDYQAPYNVNHIGTFSFKVINTNADAGVSGIPVTFGIQTQTSSSLVTTAPAISDSTGLVQAIVQSGSAGSVLVTASVTLTVDGGTVDGGQTLSAQTSVSVIGTQPSAGDSSISCSPQNLAAFAHGNLPCGSSSTNVLQTTCTVNLADRFGNPIQIAIPITLYSEAGSWKGSSQITTPPFGGMNPGQQTAVLQTNTPLPQDVDPLPATPVLLPLGEPFYNDTCAGTPRTYNPRDGLVTVIAVFRGEEEFVVPTSGIWVPGVPFTDLPQPFVDNDDSSVFAGSDICPGNGGTGVCNPPNGTWDSNSSIYVETRVLFTGSSNNTSLGAEPSTPTMFLDPPIDVPKSGTYHGTVTFGDINLNILSAAPASQSVSLASGPMGVTIGGQLNTPVNNGDQMQLTYSRVSVCDAGVTYDDAGTAVPTRICTKVTRINNFLGGFTGDFSLTQQGTAGGAQVCVYAVSIVPPDLGFKQPFCGVAE